jgi:hypothetical protein
MYCCGIQDKSRTGPGSGLSLLHSAFEVIEKGCLLLSLLHSAFGVIEKGWWASALGGLSKAKMTRKANTGGPVCNLQQQFSILFCFQELSVSHCTFLTTAPGTAQCPPLRPA